MKITFIGTSHGVPEPERRCSCTMLEIAGRYYFIDMGTGAVEDLVHRGIKLEDVRGIFITHCHGDHTNGLISFVDLISWFYKNSKPTILMPEQEAIDAMRAWIGANGTKMREDLDIGVVNEGVTYDDGVLKVTAIRTKHCRTSYAYLLEAEGKRIIFTGDLQNPKVDFPSAAFEDENNLIVVESAHFSPFITEEVLKNAKTKRVIHNHICPFNWDGELFEFARHEHPYEYRRSFDGMEINL